jgi:hypothetical protein
MWFADFSAAYQDRSERFRPVLEGLSGETAAPMQ